MLLRGLAGYRDGHYEEIIPVLSRAEFPSDETPRGRALAFMSLAEYRLGHTNEAAQA